MFICESIGNISWLNVILRASIQAHQFRIILTEYKPDEG